MTVINCNDIYTVSAAANEVYKVKFPSVGDVCVKNDTEDVIQLHFVTSPDIDEVLSIQPGEAYNNMRVPGYIYITALSDIGDIGIVYRG